MPTFEVGLDDGRTIHIAADDQDAALAGAQHFIANNPKHSPAQSEGSPWNDFRVSDSQQAVQSNAAKIKQARDLGFSDDDIASHLAKIYPTLLLNHLSGVTQQIPDGTPQADNLPPLPKDFQLEDGPWTKYQKQGTPLRFDDLPKGPTRPDGSPLQFDDLPPLPPNFQLEDGPWTKYQNTPANAPVTASGSAKAIGSGAAKGVADLPAGFIALGNLLRKYDPLNLPGMVQQQVAVPSALSKISQAADNLYTPQNDVERGLKTAGEWAPALASGPETLTGKGAAAVAKILAKRAVTQAALPAAASEGAGFVADQVAPEYAPVVRAGAALLAGGLGTRAKPEPLTAADVGAQVNRDFDAFRSAPVTIKPDVVEDAAKDIQNSLAASGLSKAPANDMVSQFIGRTTPVSLNELQETRSLLGRAAKGDTPEAVAAGRAKSAIDQLVDRLKPSDTVAGGHTLGDAVAALKQGRSNASVQNQLEQIEDAVYHGQTNAGVHSGDVASALRQRIGALLKSQEAMRRLEPYRSDMEKIAQGTLGLNALHKVAHLAGGTGGWHSGPWWLGALLAEPVSGAAAIAMAAMPFAGMGLKKLEAGRTLAKTAELRAKIAQQARGLPQPVANNPWPSRALITALNANRAPQ
jgi:hypothetical protein